MTTDPNNESFAVATQRSMNLRQGSKSIRSALGCSREIDRRALATDLEE